MFQAKWKPSFTPASWRINPHNGYLNSCSIEPIPPRLITEDDLTEGYYRIVVESDDEGVEFQCCAIGVASVFSWGSDTRWKYEEALRARVGRSITCWNDDGGVPRSERAEVINQVLREMGVGE